MTLERPTGADRTAHRLRSLLVTHHEQSGRPLNKRLLLPEGPGAARGARDREPGDGGVPLPHVSGKSIREHWLARFEILAPGAKDRAKWGGGAALSAPFSSRLDRE
jgi:hypothetical protein